MCICVNYTCKFDCVDIMLGVGKITVGLNRV